MFGERVVVKFSVLLPKFVKELKMNEWKNRRENLLY
jgi:hypothetical protein